MVGAGIHDGDLLIVDQSQKKPNGEFTLKSLVQTQNWFELQHS
jgi:SOS-response transcriptional repressor LexA